MDVLAGTAASLWVDFATTKGSLIPDAGSVSYSLYSQTGIAYSLDVPLTPDPDQTGVSVDLSSFGHTIDGTRRFEKRRLVVRFTSAGQTYTVNRTYRVVPLPQFTASPSDVRTFLGLNEDELTDEEIDMFEAFLRLETSVDPSLLATALSSGTYDEAQANEAITLLAALKLIPSLQLRVGQELAQGSDKFKRFSAAVPDWAALEAQAQGRLGLILQTLDPVIVDTAIPTFISFGSRIDAITGV